jgi:hypothetical protein
MRVTFAVIALLVILAVAVPTAAIANGANGGKLSRDCLRPLAYTGLLSRDYWDDENVPVYEGVGYYGGIQVFKNRTSKTGANRVMCAGYFRWTGDALPHWVNSHDDDLDGRDEDHPFEDIWGGFDGQVRSFLLMAAKGCKTSVTMTALYLPKPFRRTVDATEGNRNVTQGWRWVGGNPGVIDINVKTTCPNRAIEIPLPSD